MGRSASGTVARPGFERLVAAPTPNAPANSATGIRYRAAIRPIQLPVASSGKGRGTTGQGCASGCHGGDSLKVLKSDALNVIANR